MVWDSFFLTEDVSDKHTNRLLFHLNIIWLTFNLGTINFMYSSFLFKKKTLRFQTFTWSYYNNALIHLKIVSITMRHLTDKLIAWFQSIPSNTVKLFKHWSQLILFILRIKIILITSFCFLKNRFYCSSWSIQTDIIVRNSMYQCFYKDFEFLNLWVKVKKEGDHIRFMYFK